MGLIVFGGELPPGGGGFDDGFSMSSSCSSSFSTDSDCRLKVVCRAAITAFLGTGWNNMNELEACFFTTRDFRELGPEPLLFVLVAMTIDTRRPLVLGGVPLGLLLGEAELDFEEDFEEAELDFAPGGALACRLFALSLLSLLGVPPANTEEFSA